MKRLRASIQPRYGTARFRFAPSIALLVTTGIVAISNCREARADALASPVPIYWFSGTNGVNPAAGLTQARDGTLWGTTLSGGEFNRGTIFQVTTNGILVTLVSFAGTNGATPYGGLVQTTDGSFYGTTTFGGANSFGTAFRLGTNSDLLTLVSFTGINGANPYSKMVQAEDGNLYGTTSSGGDNNLGTVFQMTTNGVVTTLASFAGTNGAYPYAGLVEGSAGLFYGTTASGGASNRGTVFQLSSDGTVSTIVSLDTVTGAGPFSSLILAKDGNLYGVTSSGGAKGYGTVFQTETNGATRALFPLGGPNASLIGNPVVQAADGNLYGTSYKGGGNSGQLFRITPDGLVQSMVNFNVNGINGSGPCGGLLFAQDGCLYGVTQSGGFIGRFGVGVIFRLNISLLPPAISLQPQGTMSLPGSNVTFNVLASGQWPLFYEWSKDGVPFATSTNATYTITNAQTFDSGTYSVLVSNVLGTVLSSNATLNVGPVAITRQPSDSIVAAGYDFSLTVGVASDSPVAYTWRKDDAAILNATNATLTISNIQSTDAGPYSVVVANSDGSVTSSIVQLKVVSPYTFGTVAGTVGTGGESNGTKNVAQFESPVRVAIDAGGNIYVSDRNEQTIRKVSSDGQVSTLAGSAGVIGTSDGLGSAALFNFPEGIATDSATNIYVADNFNQTIRKISPEGVVTTLAGVPGVAGLVDGPAGTALFSQPSDVAVDKAGNVFVAEWKNQAIREILTNGMVITLGRTATLPTGVAVNKKGNVYFSGQDNFASSGSVGEVLPGGQTNIIAKVPTDLYGIKVDEQGNCFVGSLQDNAIREITSGGNQVILAGIPGIPGYADGSGSSARFDGFRMGIELDALGNLYVADTINDVIRKGVPFVVTTPPLSQAALRGTPITLDAAMPNTQGYSFQWLSNGVPIFGETNLTLSLGTLERSNSGWYSLSIDNGLGNSVQLAALVRALVPSVLQSPEVASNSTVHLLFQDEDGGVPYDLSKVEVQWRTSIADTNWQTLTNTLSQVSGFIAIDDTNGVNNLPGRYYRVLEQ